MRVACSSGVALVSMPDVSERLEEPLITGSLGPKIVKAERFLRPPANPHLDAGQETGKWRAMQPLLGPQRLRGTTLGAFEATRLADGLADPAAVDAATLSAAATNRLLDTSIVVP